MTDKKAERLLNNEADAILDKSREKILENCGVKEKDHSAGRIILKALAVAASVAFIAAFAYVCYLPVYMKNNGLLPASGETDTAKGSTAPVTSETGPAPSSAEETPDDPVQTGEKLTLDAVIGIIASSKTYKETCDKIAEIGEFAWIYGSGIVRTAYTLYSDYSEGEAVGYLTVSDLNIGFTVGPNSYVLCRSGDCLPSAYGEETDPVSGYECDYGEYNGYRVSLAPGMAEVISDIEVGGYSFIFGSSFEIKAEKDGISCDLKEAYEKGFLTEDDIAKINMIHRSRYGAYYYSPEEIEKAVRYDAGLTDILKNNPDQDDISGIQLSLFKSIYGKSGTDPVEEITLPDYSGYENAFAPDRFLVCIMKKSDGSEYTVEDFPELELTAVGKLMDYKDGTCALVLCLKYPGEENVLEAIRLMLARDDVRSAEPDFIMSITD